MVAINVHSPYRPLSLKGSPLTAKRERPSDAARPTLMMRGRATNHGGPLPSAETRIAGPWARIAAVWCGGACMHAGVRASVHHCVCFHACGRPSVHPSVRAIVNLCVCPCVRAPVLLHPSVRPSARAVPMPCCDDATPMPRRADAMPANLPRLPNVTQKYERLGCLFLREVHA